MRATILGLGSYIPPLVRRNDWWPERVVDVWRQKAEIKRVSKPEQKWFDGLTPGQQAVLRESEALSADPFRGAVERRVMPDDMVSSQMETLAAEDALRKAGVAREDIDFLVVQSVAPDFLHTANACAVHRNLKLKKTCTTLSIEMMCNSFLQQLALAEAQVISGRSRLGLLVQSSAMSRFINLDVPGSAWFGDGAAAAVVGRTQLNEGILGIAHSTYSDQFGLVVSGIPGKRWYDDGKPYPYVADKKALRTLFMNVADEATDVLGRALEQAGVRAEQISFLACHQATPWLPKVVAEQAGLRNAKHLNTFKSTGNIFGANVPHILDVAQREGLLRKGDLVALFSGGAGTTVCGAVVRWAFD